MYKLLYNSTCILRLADGASIPSNPQNADYQDYLSWLDAGNTPEPADEPPPSKPKVELPEPADVDGMDLVALRGVVKLLIERAGG